MLELERKDLQLVQLQTEIRSTLSDTMAHHNFAGWVKHGKYAEK